MSGPPPKPLERARAEGNPGHRKLPQNTAAIVGLPVSTPAPEHLGDAGKALFGLILCECEGWLGLGDQAIVIQLCESADRHAGLLERLRHEGDVLHTVDGYAYPHPAAGMVASLDAQMTRWFSLLGLTPADRSRLGLVQAKRCTNA